MFICLLSDSYTNYCGFKSSVRSEPLFSSSSLPFPKVPSYYTVVVGSTRPTSPRSRSLIRRVELVIPHEGYFVDPDRRKIPDDDIALLKLLEPLDFTGDDVTPICLTDSGGSLPISTVCYVAGWGMSIPRQPGKYIFSAYL